MLATARLFLGVIEFFTDLRGQFGIGALGGVLGQLLEPLALVIVQIIRQLIQCFGDESQRRRIKMDADSTKVSRNLIMLLLW